MPSDLLDDVPWWVWATGQWGAASILLVVALARVRSGRRLLPRLLVAFMVFGALAAWIVGSVPSAVLAVSSGRSSAAILRSPLEALVAIVLTGSVFTAPVAVATWAWARVRDALPPEVPFAATFLVASWAWATRGAPGIPALLLWTTATTVGAYAAWFLVEGLDRLRSGEDVGPSAATRAAAGRVVSLLRRRGRPDPIVVRTDPVGISGASVHDPDDDVTAGLTPATASADASSTNAAHPP